MAKFTDGNILDKLDFLEAPSMVKIYTEIIRRKYKRRFLYAYSKYLVSVSARYIGAKEPYVPLGEVVASRAAHGLQQLQNSNPNLNNLPFTER